VLACHLFSEANNQCWYRFAVICPWPFCFITVIHNLMTAPQICARCWECKLIKLFFLSYFVNFVKNNENFAYHEGKGSHLVVILNLVDYELLCFVWENQKQLNTIQSSFSVKSKETIEENVNWCSRRQNNWRWST